MVRPELASVSVSYLEGSLVFAATDSFRLAEKKVQTAMSNDFSDILLPQKNASELVHVLASLSEDTVSISTDDSQLYLKSMSALSVRFISRVIDASFPNYREIIPKAFTTEATILTKDLSSVLKKAKLFSNASQQVSFHIYPKKKVFSVTAQNQDVGEMDELIEAAVTGEDIDINFNSTYVGDSLQSIHADSLTFSFAGNGKPLVIRPIGDLSFMYLVMPLNR
jgi:DNA polymerase-3 subunit beta